jgi:hypothetical protein
MQRRWALAAPTREGIRWRVAFHAVANMCACPACYDESNDCTWTRFETHSVLEVVCSTKSAPPKVHMTLQHQETPCSLKRARKSFGMIC